MEQFRNFYTTHNPKNFEDAIEKFAIFGGVNWGDIDSSKPSIDLIENIILPDFRYIRNDVTELTTGMPLYHSILTGIAMGDGKIHTAFKRANISSDIGTNAIEELCEVGIIELKKGNQFFTSWKEREIVDNKLFFTSPFLRFWFAFISPIFKGIRDGDYKEIRERFENRKSEFIQLPFIELSHELVKFNFQDDSIKEIGTYWDNSIDLDIFAKTQSGKIIVGTSKYTNSKIKKSELTKLKESCIKANIEADIFVFISKSGFSNELKALKGKNLRLFNLKNFKKLVE